MSVVRILFTFSESGSATYDLQALFTSIQSGQVHNLSEFFAICEIISRKGGYKYCPGIDVVHYFDHYHSVIRYHIKSVRSWELPFKRIDSINCFIWYQIPKNATAVEKSSDMVLCKSCKRLHSDLDYQRRRSQVSPSRRASRQLPSSSSKLKYLSPMSLSKRKQATQKERSSDKSKLTRFADCVVTVDDEQSDELAKVMEKIEETCTSELEEVFKDADHRSCGESIRGVWEDDKCNWKTSFFKDQQSNNKWQYYSNIFY